MGSQAIDHVCDRWKRLGLIFERREPLPELSGGVVKARRQAGGFERSGDFFHLTDVAPRLRGCYCGGLLATAVEVRLRAVQEAQRRAQLLAGLRGTVVDVGSGTGANLSHFRHAERVVLVDGIGVVAEFAGLVFGAGLADFLRLRERTDRGRREFR